MINMRLKGFRIPEETLKHLERMLEVQGLTFSEYVRSLIIRDLDERGFFAAKLKAELEGG